MTVTVGFPNKTGGLSAQQTLALGGKEFFTYRGIAKIEPGASYASVAIKLPSGEKGFDDVANLVVPANSEILSIKFKTGGAITIDGTATGTLKVATAATVTTADLIAESSAATSNVVAAETVINDNPIDSTTTVGGSAVTYKLFATDGSNVADTMSVSAETLVYVEICGYYPSAFPVDRDFGELRDNSIYTDVVN
jgi:hypothetical protein